MVILLCSFFEAVRLPWKLVISGKNPQGKMLRFHHGDRVLPQADWGHIYCMVGIPPYRPTQWFYCEPTLPVPLGWDVVKNGPNILPELRNYGATMSGNEGTGVAAEEISEELAQTIAESTQKKLQEYIRDILIAVFIGSITAVTTQIILDGVRESDWYHRRIKRTKPPKRS